MMLIPVNTPGQTGFISDISNINLPPEAWSTADNVRCYSGIVEKMRSDKLARALVSPGFVIPYQYPTGFYFFVLRDNGVFSVTNNQEVDISSGAEYDNTLGWYYTILNGIPIATNGSDLPVAIANPTTDPEAIPLPNWPSSWRAEIITSFLNVAVAARIYDNGNFLPFTIRSSHPADPGAVPPNWSIADPTSLAQSTDLSETNDQILDMVSLRDTLVIYKEETTWLMRIGGQLGLFAFSNYTRSSGILARGCAVEFGDGLHFVVTKDDILVHNGVAEPKPVAEARVRTWFFKQLNKDLLHKTYVTVFSPKSEIFINYIPVGETTYRRALVWNWRSNTWYTKEIGEASQIFFSGYPVGADQLTWEGAGDLTWDEANFSWRKFASPYSNRTLVRVAPDGLYEMEVTDDASRKPVLERLDFPFGEFTQNGNLAPVYERAKLYRKFMPRFIAEKGTEFKISFGVRNDLSDLIRWYGPYRYVHGRHNSISIGRRCRYLSYRIECTDTAFWQLVGWNLDLEQAGGV